MNENIKNILQEYKNSTNNFTTKTWFEIANKILENVNLNDLYIKPEINNIELLKILRNKKLLKNKTIKSNNIYLNEKYIEQDLINIKKLSFNSFYPILLIKLLDYNILNINNEKYYIFFKYMFNNILITKNTDLYFITKVIVNYFYGILACRVYTNEIYSNNLKEFYNYKYFIYENIKNKLQDNLIYLDTDCFYYIDNNFNINFNIPFEIENINSFKIYKAKKYIEVKNNIIKTKGIK